MKDRLDAPDIIRLVQLISSHGRGNMKQPKCRECGRTQEELGNIKISPSSGLCRLCALKHMTSWEEIAKQKGKEIKDEG